MTTVNFDAIDQDIERLKQRVEKLEQLKRLAQDPDLQSYVVRNGGSGTTRMATAQIPLAQNETRPETGNDGPRKKGDFMKLVLSYAPVGRDFTVREVVDTMQRAGAPFVASDRGVAVLTALQSLAGRNLVRQTIQGKGRRPSMFRKLEEGN